MEQGQQAQSEPTCKPKTYLLMSASIDAYQKPVVLIDVSDADLMNIHGPYFRGTSPGLMRVKLPELQPY
jgi:hypothetical protein